MAKENKILSASRIKTLESCSWLYWCNYHLKVPQKSNTGALRGTIVHLVLELLISKKRKRYFNKIIKNESIEATPSIARLVKKHIRKYQLFNQEPDRHYKLCDSMILVALKNDFYLNGNKSLDVEYKFIIKNETPEYEITGFIDKAAKFVGENKILIVDYKTSKLKFSGEDLVSNLQGMVYSLASKKVWPDFEPVIEFLFLKHPKDPAQRLEFNEEQLKGLEHYLSHVYKMINSFDEKSAMSNFAADKGMPSKNEGFKGALLCGFARKKGQLKKDGNPMWHCPYKFDFEYYALIDKEGETIKSALDKKDLKPNKDQKIRRVKYGGCPKFKPHDPFDF